MSESKVLTINPEIKFQLQDNGFQLMDEQNVQNSGFYAYQDIQSIELHKTWYPSLAKYLRAFTWILNGVPLFPNAESCKKAKVVLKIKKKNLGIWLTDPKMAKKAKMLKELLDSKKNYIS